MNRLALGPGAGRALALPQASPALFTALLVFGFPVAPWRTIRYPDLRGAGRFEGDHFDPEKWKKRVPNPSLDRWGGLTFENAAVAAAHVPPPASYRAAWFRFDNAADTSTAIGDPTESAEPQMQGPATLPQAVGSFVRVDISAVSSSYPSWNPPVHAYFRRMPDGWALVGLERLLGAASGASRATAWASKAGGFSAGNVTMEQVPPK